MWKFFNPGLDNVKSIKTLRERFPNHQYLNGVFKNTKGVYAIPKDYIENKKYGQHYPSRNKELEGVEFWEPTEENLKNFDYSKYECDSPYKVKVRLGCGQEINIVPALALPRKIMLFEDRYEIEETENTDIEVAKRLNTKFEYGKLAFDLIHVYADGELTYNVPDLYKLIKIGFKYSYDLPIDILNLIFDISEYDIDALFYACIGDNLESVKKKEE